MLVIRAIELTQLLGNNVVINPMHQTLNQAEFNITVEA
jgi:hypothetical protein